MILGFRPKTFGFFLLWLALFTFSLRNLCLFYGHKDIVEMSYSQIDLYIQCNPQILGFVHGNLLTNFKIDMNIQKF